MEATLNELIDTVDIKWYCSQEPKPYLNLIQRLIEDFYDYLETVRLNDTVLFQFEGYRYFLYSWLDFQARLSLTGSPAQSQQKQQNEAGTVETAGLMDFSGKYLLIDVWSHSSGPCLREIPRMEDLKHEMEGRNQEIIAFCLSDEKPWKQKMKELGLQVKGQ
jgi:hypothetical protein